MSQTMSSFWSQVPNFVVLCLGKLVANKDIPCFALNVYWYRKLKACIGQFPHLLADVIDSNVRRWPYRSYTPESTRYLVRQVTVCTSLENNYDELLRFHSLRSISVRYRNELDSKVNTQMITVLQKLVDLKSVSITILALNGQRIGNVDFMLALPEKVTSLNLSRKDDLVYLEKQFPHLLHFDAPWEQGVEVYCNQMKNLRSLVFDGIPNSFFFLTIMEQLESFTWHVHRDGDYVFSAEVWNRFAVTVRPALRKLYLDTTNFDFHFMSSSPNTLKLPFVSTLMLEFFRSNDYLPIQHAKMLLPGIKHFHVHSQGDTDLEWFAGRIQSDLQISHLDSLSIYCDMPHNSFREYTRMTYYKGDSKANLTRRTTLGI